MIDNKKIEEAARYYCNNRYSASQDTPFIAEGFRQGAKWAINEFLKNLWHPIEEKPERNTPYLAQLSVNPFETLRSFETFSDSELWELFSKNDIIRWCYIDDLLPKKKEEMKRNKHSLKISRSFFGDTTLDGYPVITYSNDELKILKNLLTRVLDEVNEYIKD